MKTLQDKIEDKLIAIITADPTVIKNVALNNYSMVVKSIPIHINVPADAGAVVTINYIPSSAMFAASLRSLLDTKEATAKAQKIADTVTSLASTLDVS